MALSSICKVNIVFEVGLKFLYFVIFISQIRIYLKENLK